MAQWMGQFTGHTHATKVKDMEESLRKAVDAFAAAQSADQLRKLQILRHLASRLLGARPKLLRARISVAAELKYKQKKVHCQQVLGLELRAQELEVQGVDGILKEFGVHERHAEPAHAANPR